MRSTVISLTAAGVFALVPGCGVVSAAADTDTPAVDATVQDSDQTRDGIDSADSDSGSSSDAVCGQRMLGDGWVSGDGLSGLEPVPSEFDPQTSITASYVPAPNTEDVLGAFRFICGAGQLLYDDPLMFPGLPGMSHLHQFYGNLGANGCSTYESLRTSGATTCGSPGANAANRSAYWVPALLDGRGHVIQPAYISIYYKRTPRTSAFCTDGRMVRECVPLPNGLRVIFGFNVQTGNADHPFTFFCDGAAGEFASLTEAAAVCPAGAHLGIHASAPPCWDGIHLDSPDHRSHVAYPLDTHLGYFACPSTHPYGIPGLTLSLAFLMVDGEDTSLWHLSSDEHFPGLPPGTTMHADYFEAWDSTVKSMWTDHCIDEQLNCSGGALGNGFSIIGADQPRYLMGGVWTPLWENPNRLVPVPPLP